jgi:hypothetical protein
MSLMDFSSWPREQEQSFVVYEQRTQEASSKALIGGIIAGAIVFVLAIGIYAGVEPDRTNYGKDMNMQNLNKKQDGK